MKISVSLPEADVAFLDEVAKAAGLASRSAAVQHALHRLRALSYERDYAEAWHEWQADDTAPWEAAATDGVGTEASRRNAQ